MSRITAPVSKLSRSLNSAAAASRSSGLLESHYTTNHGAILMPKYAELLQNRRPRDHHDSARTLSTTHRPTPQPTRSSPTQRQMQTFSSTTPAPSSAIPSMDHTVLPATPLDTPNPLAGMRMPLLPDSFTTSHASLYEQPQDDLPLSRPQISIVAAHPENVTTAAALTEVEGFGVDGVELKWAHESEAAAEQEKPGMLRDLWKGLVDDVVGSQRKPAL
ncbi:hypothetical protein CCHL11_06524 [Colletotrichum chlorophyti]|uniref:Uncharacterized protein n=1 Tax=Colletotrichum chlorophyti TaxID=708187 RepID=A0A1Q8RS24_9PEZI|nr:hypothetical protein CCHL11_06524 [Colletotrichum chlorophyti]